MNRGLHRRAALASLRHLALAVAIVGLAACGSDAPSSSGEVGSARLALSLPAESKIDHIDYKLIFTFLEADPPVVYNTWEDTSSRFNGELLAILPCQTEPDGDGLNMVEVVADVWYQDNPEPVQVEKTAVFTCVRNADTRVNIVLNVVQAADIGFADIDIGAAGTLCGGKIDWLPDSYLGVCADASCGDSSAVFAFANACETVTSEQPIFWICGASAEWNLGTNHATAYFATPETDGTWDFGLVALDPLKMLQVDPTLTDAEGVLQVWTGVSFVRTVLTIQGGLRIAQAPETIILDFAAVLGVQPQEPGGPSPDVLLYGVNTDEGAYVSFQRRFGPCEQDVEGVALYDSYHVLDVRRDGDFRVRLLLEDTTYEFVVMTATCETGWDTTTNRPTVTCSEPESLSAVGDQP